MEYAPIGVVRSRFRKPADHEKMLSYKSKIVVAEEYAEGLQGIEKCDHLMVTFHFHLSDEYRLVAPRRDGNVRGVFASRSPHRPNPLGITTVELLDVQGRHLTVRGLDAVDGTPVLDIKPHARCFDTPEG